MVSYFHPDISLSLKNVARVIRPAPIEATVLAKALGLPEGELSSLKDSMKDPELHRIEVVHKWLWYEQRRSWKKLVTALNQIGRQDLALEVQEKYLSSSTCLRASFHSKYLSKYDIVPVGIFFIGTPLSSICTLGYIFLHSFMPLTSRMLGFDQRTFTVSSLSHTHTHTQLSSSTSPLRTKYL